MDVHCNRINFECTDSNLSFLTLILFKSMAAGGEFVGSKKTYVNFVAVQGAIQIRPHSFLRILGAQATWGASNSLIVDSFGGGSDPSFFKPWRAMLLESLRIFWILLEFL